MARHEIGFAPLPIDNLNVYGKSSNKVVGYMAAGLAVIASDLPAYREVIRSGENGYLGGSIQDYNDAYQQLADPGRRQAVAQAGYEAVRERFSPSRLAQRLLEGLS
jgi:glycosyltransferase involved in cell wall biosynthesis